MKKVLALLVAAMMIVTSFGMVSFAAEANTNVYNGNYSAKVTISDGNYAFCGNNWVTLEPNTDYIMSGWSKGSGSALLRLNKNDSWDGSMAVSLDLGGGDWRQSSMEFNSGDEVTGARVHIVTNFYGGTGTRYVDDLFIAKKSDPTVNLLSNPGFEEEGGWNYNDGVFDRESSQVVIKDGVATDETNPDVGGGEEPDPGEGEEPNPGEGEEPNPGEGEDVNYNVYEGHYSAKINCSNSDGFTYFNGGTIALEPNTDYILTAWSKGYGSPSVRVLRPDWGGSIVEHSLVSGGVWQKLERTFNTGDYTSGVFVLTNNPYGNNGTMYVDNVSLAKASDPTTNLVRDPGFEGDGWGFSSDNTIFVKEYSKTYMEAGSEPVNYVENVIDQPGGHNGINLYTGHKSLAYVASDDAKAVTQKVDLEAKKEYKASFWTRSPEGLKVNFVVRDASGNAIYTKEVKAESYWVRQELLFTTTNAVTDGTYGFESVAGQSGELYIDYAMLYARYRIDGTGAVQMISDYSFENDNGAWSGVENVYGDGKGGFSLYISDQGTLGDVSGGIRVMCVGDSITAGVGATNLDGGYKKVLYDLYEGEDVDINFVGPNGLGSWSGYEDGSGHAGNSGWRIDQVEGSINGWVKQYEPQAMLLMIGTNDILQNNADNNFAANAPARLESTIDIILNANPDIKLFVASIPPLNNSYNDGLVKAYNAEIPGIVAKKGSNVQFVDIYGAFPNMWTGISGDYVHPNDEGYQIIANKWFEDTKDVVTSLSPNSFVPDNGTAYDGEYSLKYNPYYAPYYTVLSWEMYARQFNVKANTDYTFSMMVKGDQGVSLQTRLQTNWSDGILYTLTSSAGPKWTKSEATFNTGDNTTLIVSFFNNCMSTGNMYIDCIELTEVTTGENIISNSSLEADEDGNIPTWGTPGFPWSIVKNEGGAVTPPVEPDPDPQPPVIPPVEEGDYNVEAVYDEAFEEEGKAVVEVKLSAADNGNKTILVGSNELYYSIQREVYVGMIDASAISGEVITGLSVVAGSPTIFVYGNVDGDYDFEDIAEAIDSSDLAILKSFIKGARKLIGANLMASDLDGDGLSDSSDLIALKNYVKSGKIFGILK